MIPTVSSLASPEVDNLRCRYSDGKVGIMILDFSDAIKKTSKSNFKSTL